MGRRKTAKTRRLTRCGKTRRHRHRHHYFVPVVGGKPRQLTKDVIPQAACHPNIYHKQKPVTKDTCITEDLLKKLVSHHDIQHKDHSLRGEDKAPIEVLQHIRQENTKCHKKDGNKTSQDECLLKDTGMRSNEVKQIFAPKQDWKTPNEWLSNFDIEKVMDQYHQTFPEFRFFGPVPIDFDEPDVCRRSGDNLCRFHLKQELAKGKTKFGFIFNLDFEKGPGTHWVSMYYDSNPADPLLYYFDSGGKSNTPPDRFRRIRDLAENIIQQARNIPSFKPPVFECNKIGHQQGNTECGVYSLFFIVTALTRKLDYSDNLKLSTDEIRALFNGDEVNGKKETITDEQMSHFRRVFFSGGGIE